MPTNPPSTEPSPGGQEERVPADQWWISGDHWIGCTDRVYFDKLVEYSVQKDNDAFRKALLAGYLDGTCTAFKSGEVVYVTQAPFLSGLVKVRRKGELKEYWTNLEAITHTLRRTPEPARTPEERSIGVYRD
jgi:hypothetical protein